MQFYINQALVLAVAISSLPSHVFGSPAPHLKGKRSIEIRDGVEHNIFQHEASGAQLDFVKNSGFCETTPGVNQYSGYFTVGKNMSMWFWFFEARHHPHSAPLAMWLNGGPGCSSMIGLFEENGPCQFYNGSSTPSLNPYSWNEYANMIYVDEPIGTGFSYGTDAANGTVGAAPFVWNLMQAFFASFPQYENRDFGLFTESYGGHYGPEFAYYFQAQNDLIDSGDLDAEEINLTALGINNGWFDAIIQEKEYISFSINNSYYPLINASIAESYLDTYYNSCLPALIPCNSTVGLLSTCQAARKVCNGMDNYYGTYYPTNFNAYDIRQISNDSSTFFPPSTYINYLYDPEIQKRIGARSNYSECSDDVDKPFGAGADSQRSFLPALSSVVQSGINVLIWAGDADSVCDWFGGFGAVNAIDFDGQEKFVAKKVKDYTVDGVVGGTYKKVDNLAWLRVYGSGHEVPAFKPELSLQVFKQTMKRRGIHST